ncbi:phosphotransferase [Nonomuraea sp. NPDC050663]|uniref:phosphotransferase n=1 Tax=Nonomuraea sp. NPDC050663 TaxID=3364370 RepID=UPI0037B40C6C
MKTLPDNPNLDHLRRQAKDLLSGLRDSEPGTTLARAQASLAGQYGFASWPELKAEVDRRRDTAETADPRLARDLAERFGLGEVIEPMRSLARPDESGRRWSLRTGRGRWAVRTMDTWHAIVDAETEVALQEAALDRGVALPVPVRGRSGALVEEVGGHSWRVCEWPHSGPPLSAPVGAAACRQVGEILAILHGLRLPVDRVSPWHLHRHRCQSWPGLAAEARSRHAPWSDELDKAVAVLTELETVGAGEPAPEVVVLTHNSLGPGNARHGRDGRLVVTGWEHAGGQPPAWELAEALMNWCVDPDGGVNAAGARALVEGYGPARTLQLGDFRGAVTSLDNYVSGQVWVALEASIGEDLRFAERNMRHLLTHLPNLAALERLLTVTS